MYFGDEKPDCKKNCDVCKNYKMVSNAISDFHSARDYQKFGLTNSADYVETFGELYGEGRGGISKDSEDYSNEVSDKFGDDPRQKKDTELLNSIKEQFALRRGDSSISRQSEDPNLKYANVRAAEATSRKVAGLSVQTRESYVKYFKDLLKKNWLSAHERAFEFTDKDFEDAAKDMEYNIFSGSTVNATYKKKIANEVSELRKMTSKSKPHPLILNGKSADSGPDQPSLGAIMKGIEENLQKAKDSKTDDEASQGSSGSDQARMMDSNPFVTAGDVMKLLKRKEDQEYDIETNGMASDDDKVGVHSMSESDEEISFLEDTGIEKAEDGDKVNSIHSAVESEHNSFIFPKDSKVVVIPGLDEPYSPAGSLEIVVSPDDVTVDHSPGKPDLKRKYDNLFGDSSPEDVESPSKAPKTDKNPSLSLRHSKIHLKSSKTPSKTLEKLHKHRHEKKPRDSAVDKEREAKKKEFSDVVVKYLMPYYKKRRINDKDSFKVLARKIVHTLLPKENDYPEPKIKKYINTIYKKGLFKKSPSDIEKYSLSA